MRKYVIVVFCFALFVAALVLALVLKSKYPVKYKSEISSFASEYDLDPALVAAIVYAESGYNKNAKSQKGALGLMQLMPETANAVAEQLGAVQYDLFDPRANLKFGCYYLNYLHTRFDTEIEVLCAYNAGETRTNEWKTGFGELTQDKIPYAETKTYVKKVLKAKKFYEKKYSK